MIIGLIGFEFQSPNKGVEALSYSFIAILNSLLKEETVIYLFDTCGLGDFPNYFPSLKFIQIPPILKDLSFNFIRTIIKCDVIFDVTMGDSFSDIYSYKYFRHLIIRKKVAQFFNKKYVLLPQTYGPFIQKKSIKLSQSVFANSYKIFARDSLSQDFLIAQFNAKNVQLATDMAFLLPYDKNRFSLELQTKKKKLGINISGLLYRGGFTGENQFNLKLNYKVYIHKLIEHYLNLSEFQIYLIPHVIDLDKDSYDDDYKISVQIANSYDSIIVSPLFKNPIDAKSYISNMDFFIGSRMHSTIASFSSNIHTIPISYSRKFEGLFSSLDYKFTINAREDSTETALINTFKSIEEHFFYTIIREQALKKVNLLNNNFKVSIQNILNSV